MNQMYPRTITVTRVAETFTTADGLHQTETTVASNVKANIQLKRDMGFQSPHAFPAGSNTDTPMPLWVLYCQLPNGTLKKMDKVTDDQGMTYQIEGPYWNALGYAAQMREYKP